MVPQCILTETPEAARRNGAVHGEAIQLISFQLRRPSGEIILRRLRGIHYFDLRWRLCRRLQEGPETKECAQAALDAKKLAKLKQDS